MALRNHSTIPEFILFGLSADLHVLALQFLLFLGIYILTLMGNLMMMLVVRADSQLHTPMYYFPSHLSFLDICFSSAIIPKLLENLQSQRKPISVGGCLTQVFFMFESGDTEACLLSVMAYHHYVAICHPLLYGQMMSNQFCKGLVWGSWSLGFLGALINTLLPMNLDFSWEDSFPHYSCKLPSFFPLSCLDITANFIVLLCSSLLHGIGTCFLIVYSYTPIISTILSISSSVGRSTTSSCFSHLTIVLLFYGSASLCYLLPASGSSFELIFSLQYSVSTPLVNPLIYSLKNNQIKGAVCRTLRKYLQYIRQLA